MSTYFLSYARADSDFALRFARDLIAAEHSVWVDQFDIRPSQHWDRAVEQAVRSCDGMIVILSCRSVESPNVADEVSVAIDAGKHVIPILFQQCMIPLRMTRMQFIDATASYDEALRRCLAAMTGSDPARPEPAGPARAPASAPQAPAPALGRDVLSAAERRLTGFMGPIARRLVATAALTAFSERALYEALALSIPNPQERTSFLGWVGQPANPSAAVTPRAAAKDASGPAAQPGELDAIVKALTRQLGPIAAQLVRRESQDGAPRDVLYQRLAERISDERDRKAFLKEVGAKT